MPGMRARLHNPRAGERLTIDPRTCILFHYNDEDAIAAVRAMEHSQNDIVIICLGSDIYDYYRYTRLHDIVDLYVVPTDLHRGVLASQTLKPVYTLPECIDPIAFAGHEPEVEPTSPGSGRRMLWFGYAESFAKSMSSLLPVIRANLAEGTIESFSLIVDEHRFPNPHRLPTIPYDNTVIAHLGVCNPELAAHPTPCNSVGGFPDSP